MIKQKRLVLALLLVSVMFTGIYSQKTIVGVVSNRDNEPLENVWIYCSDDTEGVLTNIRGEYSIEVSQECKVLTYSFSGVSIDEVLDKRKVVNKQIGPDKNDRSETYRFNVMLNAGGPAIYGAISGSIVLKDIVSIDLGLGLGKAYAGTSIYLNSPFKNPDWQPYIGADIVYFEEFMGPVSILMYIPAGLRYLNYNGTSISFEIAFLSSNNERFFLDSPLWGGIRFGKYF